MSMWAPLVAGQDDIQFGARRQELSGILLVMHSAALAIL